MLSDTIEIRRKRTRRLDRVISSNRPLLGRSLSNTVSLTGTQLENLEKTCRRRLRPCSVPGPETVDNQDHRMQRRLLEDTSGQGKDGQGFELLCWMLTVNADVFLSRRITVSW